MSSRTFLDASPVSCSFPPSSAWKAALANSSSFLGLPSVFTRLLAPKRSVANTSSAFGDRSCFSRILETTSFTLICIRFFLTLTFASSIVLIDSASSSFSSSSSVFSSVFSSSFSSVSSASNAHGSRTLFDRVELFFFGTNMSLKPIRAVRVLMR